MLVDYVPFLEFTSIITQLLKQDFWKTYTRVSFPQITMKTLDYVICRGLKAFCHYVQLHSTFRTLLAHYCCATYH